jgi:hypothetical protein
MAHLFPIMTAILIRCFAVESKPIIVLQQDESPLHFRYSRYPRIIETKRTLLYCQQLFRLIWTGRKGNRDS